MSNNDTLMSSVDRFAYSNLTKFNSHGTNPYLTGLSNGKGFLFITKPLLFINPNKPTLSSSTKDQLAYDNMCSDSYFSTFLHSEAINILDKEIVNQLSYDTDLYNSNFLKLFTNEFKSFSPIDLTIETTDNFETKEGYRMPLPTHSTQSESAGQFSIPVNETQNMDFTKMIKLWVKYITYVTKGIFKANPDMIKNGQIDYMSSAYYFLMGEDGTSIKYYEKITGLYPTAVPTSGYAYTKGSSDQVQLDIPFAYTSRESMNPKILEDFNRVSLNDLSYVSDYDSAELDYEPVSSSELLNISKLTNGSHANVVKASNRDPLVVFIEGSTKSVDSFNESKFYLSFSSSVVDDNYINKLIGMSDEDKSIYKTKLEDGDY